MKHTWLSKNLRCQRGTVLIMVVVGLVALLAFTALAIDVGYAFVVRNELQNVADAAALAGVRYMGHIYEGLTQQQQQSYVFNRAEIVATTQAIALQNKAGGLGINIADADIEIGKWNGETKQLYDIGNMTTPDAMRVRARRDSTDDGNTPLSTVFARVLGINTLDVSTPATAAMTGQSTIEAGKMIPVGISVEWFRARPQFCGQPIQFHPTNSSTGCAGWHTYFRWPSNDSYLRKTVIGDWLSTDISTAPEAQAGDQFVFIGGQMSNNTFDDFEALFNREKLEDGDGNPAIWTASVPVYEAAGCENPHGYMTILGFAKTEITAVVSAPSKLFTANVACDYIELSRGSGGNYGTKGSIPNLVQ
jgi:Flp pilus assembly protein TadG